MNTQIYNKDWVIARVKKLGLKPSRGNGQNFLINPEPLTRIIEAGDVKPGDHVLEIGPGLGALTESLLDRGARVTAVEFDPKLALNLKKSIPEKFPFTIIQGDILEIAREDFLAELGPYKIIANIPYHITSDIIRKFIESKYPPTVICLLIQKEVAERIAAVPPDMSQLALFTQWSADVDYITTVTRKNFEPAPAVDSAIIRLTPRPAPQLADVDQKKLFSLIKRGFSSPRKQLANNLGLKKDESPIDPTRRAETLSIEEWITLLKRLS